MNGPPSYDFFLAHAGPDSDVAEDLYELLRSESVPFLDSRSLLLGDDWDISLPAAQRRSKVTVVLISFRTEQAFYQREEIAAAIDYARRNPESHRVVPVYLSSKDVDESVPYGLRVKHGLRMSATVTLDRVAQDLISLLRYMERSAAFAANPETDLATAAGESDLVAARRQLRALTQLAADELIDREVHRELQKEVIYRTLFVQGYIVKEEGS